MNLPQPFDRAAPTYDTDFTTTAIGRCLRGRVQARLARHFSAGDHVLELGCGTGEDALWLAGRGVSVLATDASAAMLDITRAKAAGNPLVRVEKLDLRGLPVASCQLPEKSPQSSVPSPQIQKLGTQNSELGTSYPALVFDGVFASFGPLNCLDDWRPLAAWLAERIRPGGVAAFGVMSPLCLWEIAWHGAHGEFRTAFRRWRKNSKFMPETTGLSLSSLPEEMIVRYPSIRRLSRDFAPHFQRIHIEPLGLFLPPSDVFGAVEKRPRLLKLLMRLEERYRNYGKLALLADHYWIEFERAH